MGTEVSGWLTTQRERRRDTTSAESKIQTKTTLCQSMTPKAKTISNLCQHHSQHQPFEKPALAVRSTLLLGRRLG
jgi:hypothetical protein